MPILPDYLASFTTTTTTTAVSNLKINSSNLNNIPSSVLYKNFDLHYIPNTMLNKHPVAGNTIKNITRDMQQQQQQQHHYEFNVEMENGKIGLLLGMKAFIQLFFNPIVGNLSGRFGYKNLIFFGTINLLMASLCKLN